MTQAGQADMIPTRAATRKRVRKVPDVLPEYMTTPVVAKHIGVSRSWIFDQVRRHEATGGKDGLTPYRPGRRKLLIRRVEAEELIARFQG